MIVVVTILAMLGWVPQETKAAAKRLQSFMSSCLVLTIMVGVGADTDLNQLMAAITLSNVVISFLIVVGAILGSAIVGQWVGFIRLIQPSRLAFAWQTAADQETLPYWGPPTGWD